MESNEIKKIIPFDDIWSNLNILEKRLLETSTSSNDYLTSISQYLIKTYNFLKKNFFLRKSLGNCYLSLEKEELSFFAKFFNKNAYTTTIPAQLIRKYDCEVVPIYIYRLNKFFFKMKVYEPIKFEKDFSIEHISQELNYVLEKMILKNPDQWIWTHNRWKK